MSDTTEIIAVSQEPTEATLDQYLTRVCLDATMGDVVRSREVATNVRQYTVSTMIFNAVFELDVELIKTIATRIDGTIPEENKRDGAANLLGDAIEDVLSMEHIDLLTKRALGEECDAPDIGDVLTVTSDDVPIIALAKALIAASSQLAGNNMAKRRERNLAAQIILERTGGRKVQPTKPLLETKYVEPDWMIGDKNGSDSDE